MSDAIWLRANEAWNWRIKNKQLKILIIKFKKLKTMNKKILALLAIIIIAILTIAVIVIKQKRAAQNPELTRQELVQKFQLIKSQYDAAKAQGLDVSEVERLGREAKKAFDSGDYKTASNLVRNILASLSKAGVSEPAATSSNISTPTPVSKNTLAPTSTPSASALSLSQVKNAIVYERLGDARPKRTTEEQIQILKDTKADLVFRAWWRWQPYPEKCSDISANQQIACTNGGGSYELFKNLIDKIKKEKPNTIIVSALPAQKIAEVERNEITGETLDKNKTWAMALDPQKWGLPMTKEEFQKSFVQSQQGYTGYFPDITNSDFQNLFLSWAKKQIDMGVDAIWIDLLYWQAGRLYVMTKDYYHPAVKESYDSSTKLVDEIHKYSESKGKHIYVGSWTSTMNYPYAPPKFDFVTVAPTSQEIQSGVFDDKGWTDKKSKIDAAFGNVPILSFFDWGYTGSQIETFVRLSKTDKENRLEKADKFFTDKGMIFAYPVHGGYISIKSNKNWYDAMVPEIDIYGKIIELANEKNGE